MRDRLSYYYQSYPLCFLLIVAGLLRFISVLFAKGYYAHDDHFLVVGVAQDWVNGLDRDGWFVKSFETKVSDKR